MPSADTAKLPKQTSTTTSNSGEPTSAAEKSDAAPIILAIENKIRNLEKRKTKLLKIEEDVKKGKEVTKDQKEAVSHIGEVEQQLEAMKELLKTANEGVKQQLKLKKQERKAEQKERVQLEIGRLRELLKIQDVLSTLGHDDVRSDFKEGQKGAIQLSEFEIEKLDELYRKICPSHEDLTEDQIWGEYLQDSSLIAYSLLTNSNNPVLFYEGKTYRDLRTMVDKIIGCAYFASRFGRAQSPEQAKSEAASTISNADENARVAGEKTNEHQTVGQPSALQMGISSFNGGNGTTGVMAPLASSVSPPRQCSPSTLLGQGGQPNISFLQDDQSGGGAYGTNTASFDTSAINPSMPYSTESVAFTNPAIGAYNAVPGAPAVIFSQQSNLPGGYGLQFDSTLQMAGAAAEHVMNPNAPTFVSHTDTSVYASTLVSAPQMHQEPTVAQYYVQQPAEDQRMAHQEHHTDENHDDGTNDGFVQQGDRNAQNNQGYYRRGGGFRSGERGGGSYAGRGGGFRGGYRGGRQNEGGQAHWQGQGQGQGGYEGGQGYRGRGGGGYRGGYRNDESGGGYQGRGGGRGGGGGYRGNRGGGQGGYESRGGRGGGGGYQRGGRGGGETGQE